MADALTDHHDVATTLAVSPLAVSQVDAARAARRHARPRPVGGTERRRSDSISPTCPINLAALTGAGLSGEIHAQLSRGDDILRTPPDSNPTPAAWVDTSSTLSQGDAANLASGLQLQAPRQAVVSDDNLASAGVNNYTFAQPFTLDLGHGSTIPAAAADSTLSARFTANPANPRARGRAAARRPLLRPLRERRSSAHPAASSWPRRRAGAPRPPSWTSLLAGSRTATRR